MTSLSEFEPENHDIGELSRIPLIDDDEKSQLLSSLESFEGRVEQYISHLELPVSKTLLFPSDDVTVSQIPKQRRTLTSSVSVCSLGRCSVSDFSFLTISTSPSPHLTQHRRKP